MTAHAHAAHLETSTGLDNRKLAIWTFIGSECMFFATLISNYLVNKGKSLVGPFPHEPWTSPTGQHFEPIFEIPLVTLGTALLLFSSLFVVLALSGAQRGNRKALIGWLAATIACGIFFVGMQVYEFTHFVHRGLGFTTNLFGSSFYTLTGFHGTHVTIGVLWLARSGSMPCGASSRRRSRSTWRWRRCTGTSSTWSGSSSSPSSTSSSEQGTMDSHVTADAHEHAHPTAGLYFKVGLVLFVLTALEVGLYEITYGDHAGSFAPTIKPFFVPLLLLLSAAKFALVAMFYMHLKQDSKLFTGVFVFPLIIAAFIIVALMVLQAYHFAFARSG